jgi:PAS domain S-box-containing protein
MSSQEAAEALTREQESERELRTREAELSDFFETASVGLHWVSEDGTIIRVNQAELDMFGYRRDEYLGRKLAEFHVDATIVADMLRRLVAGERINQLRARMRCRDGTVKDVLIDSSGHFQGGKFHHTRCFTRDVTDERRAQENAARLAAIVTSSADAIVGKTLDGTITSWNPAAEQIFGYSAAEMVGDSVFKLIPPELHDLERDVLERLQRGEVVELADSERVRKDGRRIWISLSVSPIRDAAGTIIGAASIKRDITERKLVDERLRDTQRLQAIGQLAGGIAHEANNQMMVVVGASHFLLRRADLSPPARLEVEQILRAADRTASVTRQLLAFSRRQMLQLREVDLNGVVESIAPMLRRALPESQELVLALGGLSGCIRADPRQLEQVLLNLTLNARDAMPQGGRIVIETRDVGRPAEFTTNPPSSNAYHMLAVRDTGHGIEQTTLGRIFEPFFTTKEVGRGTGLGLSVVHGIVSQLGGHIRVESDLGQGTTFELYFPSAQPGIEAPPSSPAEPSPVPEGTVALVVEDDARARAIAVRALTEAGYRVLEAENGRRALEVVGRSGGQVDLVITDIGLPELDGYELVRRLRAERPDLPILMMSGYADEPHRVELGPDIPLLSKPFSPDALVAAAAEVFGRRSAQPPAASGADKPSA